MDEDYVYLPIDMEGYIERNYLGGQKKQDVDWSVLDKNCSWSKLLEDSKDVEAEVTYTDIDRDGSLESETFNVDDSGRFLKWRYLDNEVDRVMRLEGSYEGLVKEIYAVSGYDTSSIEELPELEVRSPRVVFTVLTYEEELYRIHTGSEHPSSHLEDLEEETKRYNFTC